MNSTTQRQFIIKKLQEAGDRGVSYNCADCEKRLLSKRKTGYCWDCYWKNGMHRKLGVGKWMTGRKIPAGVVEKRASKMRGRKRPPFSDEWKKKIGEAGRGRMWSLEHRAKMLIIRRKTNSSPEYRSMMSRIKRGTKFDDAFKEKCRAKKIGVLNPNWNNNATYRSGKIRQSAPYRMWRQAVLKRDNYACVQCLSTYRPEADHIKPMTLNPSLMFNLDNGRTLCRECHKKTPTWGFNRQTHNYAKA